MKFRKYLEALLLILFSTITLAQQSNTSIYGKVIEENSNDPIEQATIRLLNVKDSSLIKGAISSQHGAFTIKNAPRGNYLLHVSFIGYAPFYKQIQISEKQSPINLGNIELHNETIELGEAIVIGKAPEVSVRNDTIEYNADSYKITEGSVLEDLLKKMPGVEIDSDGKITVNGKEIKKVMIDGKEFFSDDPKVASKNLPAKMIDKLQVLDKKSDMAKMTGFDDGNEETIINLTVKPGMKRGWFGNAYAGYGNKKRYEGNAMINRFINNDQITIMGGANNTNNMGFSDLASNMFSGMRGGQGRRGSFSAGSGITSSGNAGINFSKELKPTLTLGGNTNYSHSKNEALSKSNRENILPGDSSSFDNGIAMSHTKNDNFGMNFRMEWEPDTMTRLIFRPSFNFSHSINNDFTDASTLNNEKDTINTNKSNNYLKSDGYNLNAGIDFSRKLNNKGRVFSATLTGGSSNSSSDGLNRSEINYLNRTDATKNNLIDQRSQFDNKSFNYRIYLSWVEPLGHNNFIQATYSISQRKQEALKNVFSKGDNGIYNKLDSAYSQSYRNNFISQRASLSFKSQRAKFNYTLGLNLDPSYSSSENFIGDTVLSKLKRSVINLSPMARFNYMFNKRTNLRIMYNGRTSQPSVSQLQPVADISDPTNITIGNPDLNPRYTNNIFIHFQQFMPEKQRAFMILASGSYIINDIVNFTSYDQKTGVRTTTYKNVNGNFNGNLRIMMNTPLRNKKFTISSMSMGSFSNTNGYINKKKNTNHNLILSERGSIDFRSSFLDLGINGNIRYNTNSNSLQKENNRNTFNYGVGGYTTIYLPLDFKIESDINWHSNSGYGDGFKQNETLWNASLSKSFLKNNQGTLRFKIYDILQQRSNISRSITANYIQDSEYNTLSNYFMIHFIYKFSIFKGGATASDATPSGRGRHSRKFMGTHLRHRY